jgi:hypothetical protein
MCVPIHISYEDLESALNWSSSGGPYENQALICRRTGRVYLQSMNGDFEDEELPDDIEDGTLYVAVPHKNDLDLGRALVFEFVETEAPRVAAAVQAAFRQRGAYSKFKAILERESLLQRWYEYEAAATRSALERWALENGLVVNGSSRSDA